jgi:hypothetical protein
VATTVVAIPAPSAAITAVTAKCSSATVRPIPRALLVVAVLGLVMTAKASQSTVLGIAAAEGVLTSLLRLCSRETACLPTLLLSWDIGRRTRSIRLRDRRAWPTRFPRFVVFRGFSGGPLVTTMLLRHGLSLSSESRMSASERIGYAAKWSANPLLSLRRLSRSSSTIYGFATGHRGLTKTAGICGRR